jgi:hypothetical protein
VGIEEGEEMKTKRIVNLFNKIIAENYPNLEKENIHVSEAYRTPKQSVSKKKHP